MDTVVSETGRPALNWPGTGVTRVPYRVYQDADIFAYENRAIFRGPTWNFLTLEAEIPEPGDFKTSFVGSIPVIVCRDRDGEIRAMVNRCAHRGALVCLDPRGNRKSFTCVYHNWSYDLQGNLTGLAFRNGIKGQGGMPDSFDVAEHGLEQLRVTSFSGLVFGTFHPDTPPIADYLGPDMATNISRVFNRPVKVLGQYSQYLRNNWKLIVENFRDSYHASILHLFYGTFGLNRLSMEGGVLMDDAGWHHLSYSKVATDEITGTEYEGGKLPNMRQGLELNEAGFADFYPEFDDGITTAIQTIFPSLAVQQIQNSLGVRHIVPRGVDGCEIFWTLVGYADDDAELDKIRLRHSNLIGPAGYVSLEDGAIVGMVDRGIRGHDDSASVVMMDGDGVAASRSGRATEASVRGFWKAYRETTGY